MSAGDWGTIPCLVYLHFIYPSRSVYPRVPVYINKSDVRGQKKTKTILSVQWRKRLCATFPKCNSVFGNSRHGLESLHWHFGHMGWEWLLTLLCVVKCVGGWWWSCYWWWWLAKSNMWSSASASKLSSVMQSRPPSLPWDIIIIVIITVITCIIITLLTPSSSL